MTETCHRGEVQRALLTAASCAGQYRFVFNWQSEIMLQQMRGYEGSLPVTLIEYLLLPSAGRRDDIGCGSSEADRGDGKCIVWQKFTIADDFRQNCSRSHHDLPVTHPEQLKDHWDGSESKEIVVDHFLN